MKTYLIPVDFSEASINAAVYAAALSGQTNVEHIVLLNSYYVSEYERMLPTPDLTIPAADEIAENASQRVIKLHELRDRIEKLVRSGLKVSTVFSRSSLLRSVVENIERYHADVLLLGSNGNLSTDDSQIGRNVVAISKISPVPVVVVPPAAVFTGFRRVMIACDFKKVRENVPIDAIKKLFDPYHIEMLVLNIDKENRHLNADPEQLAEESALSGMLECFHPQYFYKSDTDVIGGVISFAEQHHTQLVIALPHKYSFMQSLVHSSVSHRLSVHSTAPVLLLK